MKQHTNYLFAVLLAVFLAVSFAGCASTETHRSTGQYIDDTAITAKVKAAILNDPLTKVLEIKVETYKGEVQLSGFVSSQEEADKAVELTRGVKGVTSIKNDMLIKQP
ncbi:MAG TPA: BON domain-containing protein [Gammaproteobacteria bacterium]